MTLIADRSIEEVKFAYRIERKIILSFYFPYHLVLMDWRVNVMRRFWSENNYNGINGITIETYESDGWKLALKILEGKIWWNTGTPAWTSHLCSYELQEDKC